MPSDGVVTPSGMNPLGAVATIAGTGRASTISRKWALLPCSTKACLEAFKNWRLVIFGKAGEPVCYSTSMHLLQKSIFTT
jgi:hypothetical protein